MKFHYDLSGCQQLIRDYPIYGNGAAIDKGAAVCRGLTAETDAGYMVVAPPTTLASVVGVLMEDHAVVAADADTKHDGSVITYRKVLINPFAVYLVEHTAGAIAIASIVTVTPTVTSWADAMDGGWALGSDGQLQYIVTGSAGSFVTKTASGWVAGTHTLTRIPPLFAVVGDLNTGSKTIKNPVAASTGKLRYLQHYIQATGVPLQKLDPTKHSGATYTNVKIYSDIIFTDHAFGING